MKDAHVKVHGNDLGVMIGSVVLDGNKSELGGILVYKPLDDNVPKTEMSYQEFETHVPPVSLRNLRYTFEYSQIRSVLVNGKIIWHSIENIDDEEFSYAGRGRVTVELEKFDGIYNVMKKAMILRPDLD